MYVCIMHEQEPKQVRNPKRSKDTESSGTVNVNWHMSAVNRTWLFHKSSKYS